MIARVCGELGVTWDEVSILDEPELADLYWEHIPVTMVDGHVLDRWAADERRLRAALAAAPPRQAPNTGVPE